jgi:ribosomal protein L14E/L6E/L27E
VSRVIKKYDKVKLKNGKFAVIVDVLEPQKAYIAGVEVSDGEFTVETIFHSDIAALIVEVEDDNI